MVATDRTASDPKPAGNTRRETRVPARVAALVVAVALLVALLAWGVASVRDGGPLSPSTDAEQVLRTVRLAGFDSVWVHKGGGAVTVLLQMPGVDSPADVEIAWQTAFASVAQAFRGTGEFRVDLVSGDEVVVELSAPARDVARAVESDDASALRDAIEVEYVLTPVVEVASESGDLLARATTPQDAAYLDAKNRAAELLGESGATGQEADRLARECVSMRAAVEGRPAVKVEEALKVYSNRIVASLGESDAGAERVLAEIERLAAAGGPSGGETIARLRTISLVAEALAAPAPYGDLLADTSAVGARVAESPLAEGAASDAVLAAARDGSAPDEAVRVDAFVRAGDLDMGSEGDSSVVGAVVRAISTGMPIRLADSVATVPPQAWEAYRRADGTVYWRGAAGTTFALTDGSLAGWAFSRGAAAAVDVEDVGIVYSLTLSDSVSR